MSTRRRRSPPAIARQGLELALAAPQVIAHRMARAAAAGSPMSVRDQREFTQMGMEKVVAFQQSWFAMGLEVARMQQRAALSFWQAAWMPWTAASRTPWSSAADWQRAALAIAGAGMQPIRRKAVANARRLGRSRR